MLLSAASALAHDRSKEKLAQAVGHLDVGQEIWDQQQADDDVKRRPGQNEPGQNRDERAGRHQDDGLGRSIVAAHYGDDRSKQHGQTGQLGEGIPQHIA